MAERSEGSRLAGRDQLGTAPVQQRSLALKTFKSLKFRIVLPLVIFGLVTGVVLYLFVLPLVRGFVASDINQDMQWTGQSIYTICDDSLQELLLQGAADDDISVRISKAHTLGEIENFARRNNLGLIVFTDKPYRQLLSHRFSGNALEFITSSHHLTKANPARLDGRDIYSFHIDFDPWDWHLILFKDAAVYASLEKSIRRIYVLIGLLFLASVMVVLLINRWVRQPLNDIVECLKREELPAYRGVDEFEFLSRTISKMMVAIKEKNEWIDNLISTVGAMIVVTDADGAIVMANKSFEHFVGLPKERLIGRPFMEIPGSVALAAEVRRYLQAPPADQAPLTFEDDIMLPDRRVATILWHNTAIFEESGAVKWFIGTGIDISERRNAELARLRLEEQLRHSQKMEAVGTLAGGISHEFNNLLQAISGHIQLLLLKRPADDPDRVNLSQVDEAINRAAELVRRLLTFSRKMKVDPKPVDLNQVIETTLHLLKQTLPKSIVISTSLSPDGATVMADYLQMEQILMNLATNSRDAMEPEGGELFIKTRGQWVDSASPDWHPELKPGNYVVLEFSDTGRGMDQQVAKHIFDPFFTTKDIGRGTGLGLSIVYGIITGLRGAITCTSSPGRGTGFRIFLPAIEEAGVAAEVVETEAAPAAVSGSETILVIDDEPIIRDIARDMLETFGYRILTAASGEEGLQVFAEKSCEVDLVILDLGMPGIGGEQCLKSLGLIDPTVPIVVASGYASHEIAARPQAYGAADFIAKPFRLEDMLSMIRSLLDSRRRRPRSHETGSVEGAP